MNLNNTTMFTEDIPNYGDLFTLEEWLKDCKNGFLIDYDGFGHPSDGKYMSNVFMKPSKRNDYPEGTTHIVWFNR